MAAIMTFSTLKTDVTAYCERNNNAVFIEQLPRLIMLAENRLALEAKQQGFQTVVTGTFQTFGTLADPAYLLRKPSWWRETISFTYNDTTINAATGLAYGWTPVRLRSLEYVKNFWPVSSQPGKPRFYADYNAQNFLIAPSPNLTNGYNFEFELAYYARLQPLSEESEVNWLTENVPQLLFYAAMAEAQLFLKNHDKAATWLALYNDQKGALLGENAERLADRSEVVTRG